LPPAYSADSITASAPSNTAVATSETSALVGAGLAPRQVGERLGIAEETARTALKRVFDKTGVSRQSELASLLGRLVFR